jgi:hypothetical protein
MQEGLADMEDARRDKATDEHNVIDDAIQDRGEGYTVFSIVCVIQSHYLQSLLSLFHSDHPACWSSLSAIRKETQEFSHKGLYGQGRTL